MPHPLSWEAAFRLLLQLPLFGACSILFVNSRLFKVRESFLEFEAFLKSLESAPSFSVFHKLSDHRSELRGGLGVGSHVLLILRGVPAPRAVTRQARSRGSTPRSTGAGSAGCSRCGHPLLGRRARGPSSPNRKSNARARADGPAGDSEFFLERGARANIKKARKIVRRAGKEPPKEGDEIL
jgi:hypothetical protein